MFSRIVDIARSVRVRRASEIATLAILLLTLVMVSANAWHAAHQRKQAELWYAHTLDVLLVTSNLRAAVHSELRGERGYLLTDNPRFLAPLVTGRADAALAMWRLRSLVRDNASQSAKLKRLTGQIRIFDASLDETIMLHRAGRQRDTIAVVRAGIGKHHIENVLGTIAAMDRDERRLLTIRGDKLRATMTRADASQYALTALGFVLLALAVRAALRARRAQRDADAATAELTRQALTDSLTGLANRRAFLDALDAAIVGDGRRRPALAIFDVDHFKRVNDTYGHPVGDEMLRQIAATATACVRTGDLVGRLGGEEFAILMPGATLDQAMAACERVRLQVQAQCMVLADGRVVRVTLSVGLAEVAEGESATTVIARADEALYAAKNRGRDRVLLAA